MNAIKEQYRGGPIIILNIKLEEHIKLHFYRLFVGLGIFFLSVTITLSPLEAVGQLFYY